MELTLTSWIVFMGSLWMLFSRAETVVSPDAKKAITRWLKNVKLEGTPTTWPSTFSDVFDSIFGKKHLSWRCFWRSCVASCIAVLVMTLIWAALRPLHARKQMGMIGGSGGELFGITGEFIVLAIFVVVLNLLPDYVSLLESRYIIRRMSAVQHSPGRILSLLALDVVLTVCIFFAAFYFLAFITGPLYGTSAADFLELIPEIMASFLEYDVFLSSGGRGLSFGIFFYSTFFTSVWVWLYALSGLVVKLAGYLGIGFSRLKWFLDIENKPLHSLGVSSMMLVTLIYLGAGFYRLVGSY